MTTISSVNTDIGAEFCSVGLEPRPPAHQPGALQPKQAEVLTTITSAKKKKLKSRMFMSLYYTRD